MAIKRKTKAAAKKKAGKAPRMTIRMYRIGVGDSFLVTIPRTNDDPFRMLIDCGVHTAQTGGTERIRMVAEDIVKTSDGALDVLVGTHEHWDHISGFQQAEDIFSGRLSAKRVWLAWTEDDDDDLAQKLAVKRKRYQSLAVLRAAADRIAMAAGGRAPMGFDGLMGFYGEGAGPKLKVAGDAMLRRAKGRPRYLKPGEKPLEIGDDARVFVLGPPRDEDLLKKDAPSAKASEVYEFGGHAAMAAQLQAALDWTQSPFDGQFSIPLESTKGLSFFADRYWASCSAEGPREREETGQDWRRVDLDWLEAASSLALDLDSDTNNTSLVLAIELGPKMGTSNPVVLFAADAQVGNWLGWHDKKIKWSYGGREITAADLLKRTVVYKVGHHASHNATLRALGLELMENLKLALVPTDEVMAGKVGWGTLPWPPLLTRLRAKAKDGVIRTDRNTKSARVV